MLFKIGIAEVFSTTIYRSDQQICLHSFTGDRVRTVQS